MKNNNLPDNAIEITDLTKIYKNNNEEDLIALNSVNLEIPRGSMFGLLGPNGAGKSTFINILAGLTLKTSGQAIVWGFDLDKNPRSVRASLGVVPQEIYVDPFFSPKETLHQQAGMYGVLPKDRNVDFLLKTLDLEDKSNAYTRTLSGGMKRRLLVAKSMVHRPPILILDEPTAGVDISLRRDMWRVVQNLQASGVTIILTTHYIEEAEAIADRVSVINHGEIVITENKQNLMQKMGQKLLTIELQDKISAIPESLNNYNLTITENGQSLCFAYNSQAESTGITTLLQDVKQAGLKLRDLKSAQTSLENIFEQLLKESA